MGEGVAIETADVCGPEAGTVGLLLEAGGAVLGGLLGLRSAALNNAMTTATITRPPANQKIRVLSVEFISHGSLTHSSSASQRERLPSGKK